MSSEGKAYKILIVDDEELLLESIARGFKTRGFEVLVAHSGNQGIEILKTQQVDCVLSDIRMPEGSGIDLVKKIKEKDVTRPLVLFMTGFSDVQIEEVYDLGVEAVFPKPFDRKSLIHFACERLSPQAQRWSIKPADAKPEGSLSGQFNTLSEAQKSGAFHLGRGGIFVQRSTCDHQVGQMLALEFHFQKGDITQIIGLGTLRWVRKDSNDLPKGYGIEFVYLGDSTRAQLEKFYSENKLRSYIPKK